MTTAHPTSLSGCARKSPTQQRGRERVAALLDASIAEFRASGYEGATMSAIANRAHASIGSLYQFFPNKQSIARALRTRHIEDVERLWESLSLAKSPPFTDRFADVMIRFVQTHPAFLALLDAPASTQPVGPRDRLRTRLAQMLVRLSPRLSPETAELCAETIFNINRVFLTMYARALPARRPWIVEEYRMVLHGYFTHRVYSASRSSRPRRTKPR